MKVLLVEPAFPHPRKSRNHHLRVPIGLLKIGAWLKDNGSEVMFIRMGDYSANKVLEFNPNKIMVTSLYSYYSEYVASAVKELKQLFPKVTVEVGGIFASLEPTLCKNITGCDEVNVGVVSEAEDYLPDYSLMDEEIDFQIIHTSRGCNRTCMFCGVNTIEPCFTYKQSIKDEVFKKKLVFYDNNLLANPCIEDILYELISLRKDKKINYCESQSGFDGRILKQKPYLAKLLFKAGFKKPKVAWDNDMNGEKSFIEQIEILEQGGFKRYDMGVFMLYNHDLPYLELEKKRVVCWEQKIQIMDCRYRPYTQLYDNYNARSNKPQTNEDYFIHPKWTDKEVKTFRRNVRQHNICIRYRKNWYSYKVWGKKISEDLRKKCFEMEYNQVKEIVDDVWIPSQIHTVKNSPTLDQFMGERNG